VVVVVMVVVVMAMVTTTTTTTTTTTAMMTAMMNLCFEKRKEIHVKYKGRRKRPRGMIFDAAPANARAYTRMHARALVT
jgi:hypothetical protein